MPDHDNPLYTVLLHYSHDFMGLTFIMRSSYLLSHLFSLRTLIHNMEIKCIYLQGSRLYKYSLPMSQSVVDEKTVFVFSWVNNKCVFIVNINTNSLEGKLQRELSGNTRGTVEDQEDNLVIVIHKDKELKDKSWRNRCQDRHRWLLKGSKVRNVSHMTFVYDIILQVLRY